MEVRIDQQGDSKVAIVESSGIVIGDVQGALDLMASIRYQYGCDKLILRQEHLAQEFFDLRTRLAGEILQKYVNYGVKLAIIGQFDRYDSKSLRDFITESNRGKQVFFLSDVQDGLHALHNAR